MLIISKTFQFEAAHQLVDHDGACARPHGHSYSFTLEVAGKMIPGGPKRNMVMDYGDVGAAGRRIRDMFDHMNLNDVLGEDMTTAEMISLRIFEMASREIPDLHAVIVRETAGTSCRYCPVETRQLELGEAALSEIRERLYSKVRVGAPDECWPFEGRLDDNGYGECSSVAAGTTKAHRLAAWLAGIDIEGFEVLHSCDNRPCCNPAHLSAGTHADNEADKDARGRRQKGGSHYATDLTDEQVRELWESYTAPSRPQNFSALWAVKLSVSKGVIGNITHGRSWNHITGLPSAKAKALRFDISKEGLEP